MQTGLLHLHSALRWVILIVLLLSIYYAYTNNAKGKTVWLITLISSHIMLLIGIYQWFWGTYGWTKPLPEGLSVMEDKTLRFFMVEHPVLMLLSILLITIGHSNTKKANYKKAAILFTIALIVILAAVPWPFRDVVGRGWIAGMK